MITKQILEKYSEAERRNIEIALMTLAQTGVLEVAIHEMRLAVVSRFNTTDTDAIAKEVVEVNLKATMLKGLHEFGKQIIKEKE